MPISREHNRGRVTKRSLIPSNSFIKTLYFAEDCFESPFLRNYYVRHVVGMLLVGSIFCLLMHFLGHYCIQGVGYATIQDILTGSLSSASILVLLFFLKLAATSLTIGSGGSGGVFSPSLFLGATMGGALPQVSATCAGSKRPTNTSFRSVNDPFCCNF